MCVSAHEGHNTFQIEIVKKKLKSQIELARYVLAMFGFKSPNSIWL